MVILGGWVFLMREVPLYGYPITPSELPSLLQKARAAWSSPASQSKHVPKAGVGIWALRAPTEAKL